MILETDSRQGLRTGTAASPALLDASPECPFPVTAIINSHGLDKLEQCIAIILQV